MKKLLLTLGAGTSIVTPIATVVSCDNDTKKNTEQKYNIPTIESMNIWQKGIEESKQKITKIISAFEKKGSNDKKRSFDQKITKEAISSSIKNILNNNKTHRDLFLSLIKNKSIEDAYYLMLSLRGAINPKYSALAFIGLAQGIEKRPEYADLIKGIKDDIRKKKLIVQKIILSGKLDITEIANSIINKFTIIGGTSKDKRFNGAVASAGQIRDKKLEVPSDKRIWDMGEKAMGGNDTVRYILKKVGYTLEFK